MLDYATRCYELARDVFMTVETSGSSRSNKYDAPLDAETMLDELETFQISVVLVDAPEKRHSEHKIRMVEIQNPKWYRDFCSLYRSARNDRSTRFHTAIKRAWTIKALKRIIAGETSGVYVERLLDFIEQNSGNEEIPF